MKLQFAFLADAAAITEDGRFAVVGGGFDSLDAETFPAIKSAMALVGRVVFDPAEIGKQHSLHGEIVGPDGSTLPPDMWLLLTPSALPGDPHPDNWVTICLNYQGVSFPTPGDYIIRLSIGTEILGQVRIKAILKGGEA